MESKASPTLPITSEGRLLTSWRRGPGVESGNRALRSTGSVAAACTKASRQPAAKAVSAQSSSSSTRARSPGSAGSKAGLGWLASRYRAMALESAITSEPSTNTGTWRWPDSRNKASWPKPGVTSTTV